MLDLRLAQEIGVVTITLQLGARSMIGSDLRFVGYVGPQVVNVVDLRLDATATCQCLLKAEGLVACEL